MNIVFWDIDGTLIRTSRAGLLALEEAAFELWQKSFDFTQIESAGMTDNYIAAQIIQQVLGREALAVEIDSLTSRYEQLLAGHLRQRKGWLLPSIAGILESLYQDSDYQLLLLTGNSRTGAEIKMAHFALSHYFDFEASAFCGPYFRRVDIARQALENVRACYGEAADNRIFVIGDTPNDIQCGKAIGAFTIGVATGGYSREELDRHSPWWVTDCLPSAAEFKGKLKAI
ncbi:hypothetical protein P22_2061 [Propionispora sp. 2/2-37]|uniref:HAD family hydrolase n=1 Tax=Propionispora sp. 2/2-37 TaxID=1677858 RepID=UPI0006BB8214|nr:HAD hydrolase-like protein [Propionispora sp. 2/2-37]CUH95973.1 hypothetical protein P22_2061 [Propionispora sp. 2/2-37]